MFYNDELIERCCYSFLNGIFRLVAWYCYMIRLASVSVLSKRTFYPIEIGFEILF